MPSSIVQIQFIGSRPGWSIRAMAPVISPKIAYRIIYMAANSLGETNHKEKRLGGLTLRSYARLINLPAMTPTRAPTSGLLEPADEERLVGHHPLEDLGVVLPRVFGEPGEVVGAGLPRVARSESEQPLEP